MNELEAFDEYFGILYFSRMYCVYCGLLVLSALLLASAVCGCSAGKSVAQSSDRNGPICLNAGLELTTVQVDLLKRKVKAGDGEAAYTLYLYFGCCVNDEAAADSWLRRAAELKHPQAQLIIADLIKKHKHSLSGFGANAPAAVRNLLEQSAQTEGSACHELASAYAEGYFGAPNQPMARAYLHRGADLHNRMCWMELSRYYHLGIGGPRDDAEAYYWIGLETRCTDPGSFSGQQTWLAREEIASHLSLPVLESLWNRIDDFIEQVNAQKVVVNFSPFLSGMIDPKLEAEGRRCSQQREDEHRRKCKSKR